LEVSENNVVYVFISPVPFLCSLENQKEIYHRLFGFDFTPTNYSTIILEVNGSFLVYESSTVVANGVFFEETSERVMLDQIFNESELEAAHLTSLDCFTVFGNVSTDKASSAMFGMVYEISMTSNASVIVLVIAELTDDIAEAVVLKSEVVDALVEMTLLAVSTEISATPHITIPHQRTQSYQPHQPDRINQINYVSRINHIKHINHINHINRISRNTCINQINRLSCINRINLHKRHINQTT